MTEPRLILASASPRRRELLGHLGLPFEVQPADVDETLRPGEAPATAVRRLATAKAAMLAVPGAWVVGADTLVTADGGPLGKPSDAEEARAMLLRLRNRPHQVLTGVAVIGGGKTLVSHTQTGVAMRGYTPEEIDAYIASGDPFDKAGAYAIQHPTFRPVKMINGCYCNVVGLPLAVTLALLQQAGYPAGAVARPALCKECRDWG